MDYEYLKNGSIDFLNDYHKDLYHYKHKISLEKKMKWKMLLKIKKHMYDRKRREIPRKFWKRKWVKER